MTRSFDTTPGPHLPARASVQRTMGLVLVALLPGMAAHTVVFGITALVHISLCIAFALIVEAAMLWLRGRPLQPFISDLSAPLTGVLFALAVPSTAPWWLLAIGLVAAIAVAKHLYGGLGRNPFNPAMVGVAVVVLSFPLEYTRWAAPFAWDTLAQATPLDLLRQQLQSGQTLAEVRSLPVFGQFGAQGWEWIALAYAAGGVFLLWMRVIPWQTPVATLGAVLAITLPLWLFEPDVHPSPLFHLAAGGLVFAAFFIVTDPVSGCTTPRGRLIFGAGVALLTLAIRRWGGFPDGVAFAVLLMNLAAPLIDRVSRPLWYGERGRADDA